MPLIRPFLHVAIHPSLARLPPLSALVVELFHPFLLRFRQHCYVVGTHAGPPVETPDCTFAVRFVTLFVAVGWGAVFDRKGVSLAAYPAVFEDVAHGVYG